MRGSDMEEGPDLSHLTPEERAIIESVMVRQKQEEEREQEIMRYDMTNLCTSEHCTVETQQYFENVLF